ncbi:2-phosphosulfolactate phosphatase [Halorarius litoreus]|uniref:2-phosphosulfolactate phosphatase n=1 Tax=Halorarius litoreus TaxID=2962676 RepID=UPI0020CBAC77|nr:2-phosphosulfolactate phosphatase [Halorarius litoreus]
MTDANADDGSGRGLDERLIERCEEIPATLPPGNYVVIDTLHFSNTVIELLANGATHVHITDERGEEFAYRESNPRAKIGGSPTESYEPTDGYDFFNSPSYVQRLDLDGRPASMTSSNGGRAVAKLRAVGRENVTVYVGSTMNAAALAAHLRTQEGDVHLVSSGSRGTVAVEDHIGATLISRELDGLPLSETERELFRKQLKTAKGADYVEKHEVRRRDVLDYAMNINSSRIVPKLVGESLVDIARTGGGAATEGQTAD